MDGIDLGGVHLIVNCSEPVRADSLDRLLDRFGGHGLRRLRTRGVLRHQLRPVATLGLHPHAGAVAPPTWRSCMTRTTKCSIPRPENQRSHDDRDQAMGVGRRISFRHLRRRKARRVQRARTASWSRVWHRGGHSERGPSRRVSRPRPQLDRLLRTPLPGEAAAFGVLGARITFTPATGQVVGRFKPRAPAAVMHDYGNGKAVYVGACPGLSYLKDAGFVPTELKEHYPLVQRRVLTSLAAARDVRPERCPCRDGAGPRQLPPTSLARGSPCACR